MLEDTAAGEVAGDGEVLRLLVAGESTAVGVGATGAASSMAPRLAESLARRYGRPVRWQVVGENGIRAAGLAAKLVRHRALLPADVGLILLGANDVSGLTSLGRWRRALAMVVAALAGAGAQVFVAPVPPFHLFHLLPQPLRWLLGHRARALCAARRLLAEPGRVMIIEGEFPTGRRYLAADGYHPSDAAYRLWAEQVADVMYNKELKNIVQAASEVSPDPAGP